MTIRLCLSPAPQQVEPETGVGRVILAQAKYLPALDIQLVDDPARADVIACHISRPASFPRVDVLHLHGLYFADLSHTSYQGWHHQINRNIIQTAREARYITVPSNWVAESFRRDMRIRPRVIGHGVDLNEWHPGWPNQHFVFWGKNRNTDVCDPTPAWQMAERGIDVLTTFPPLNAGEQPDTLRISGFLNAQQMRAAVGCSECYLATTMETFGIGVLEALASGVPILGYQWGALPDIVRHGVEGFLVEPGDIDGLVAGLAFIREHRSELSKNALERARAYTWERAAEQYAQLYLDVVEERAEERRGVAVVVPCHNYSRYLPQAVESLQKQTRPPEEIIIVDDCSTDDSLAVARRLAGNDPSIQVIAHEQNTGVAASRNDGIGRAKSPFIVCLDADDCLAPEYLDTCARALEGDPSLGIAYTGLVLINDAGGRTPTTWPPEFDWEIQASVSVPPSNCVPSAAMFRRSMWERAGGYQQRYAPGEDAEFWVRGLSVGFNARKVSGADLFWYRVHGGSASRTRVYTAIDHLHPWMRDKQYPMGAPGVRKPVVNSYAQPLVSVIIPLGPGHDPYLPDAIDSLLAQTFRGWEVIVVDDTGGERINERIYQVYPFIHWAHTGGMRGAGAARNIGLALARAPLSLFLDADDTLDPRALEHMLAKYAGEEGRYIYTDWVSAAEEGTNSFHELDEYDPVEWVRRLVEGRGGLNAVTVLMATADARRIGFDERLPGWEDSDFFARAAVMGIHGARLAEPLLYYRIDTGTRRRSAQAEKGRLLKLFTSRYEPYLKGKVAMSGCCGGGSGQAVMAAKRAIGLAPQAGTAAVPEAPAAGSDRVRMEFIGSETGPVPIRGAKGDVYRGANTPLHRFANVLGEDVEKLLSTGKWKVAKAPAVEVAAQAEAAKPLPPSKTTEELRREAEAALLAAKADLEKEFPLDVSAPDQPAVVAAQAQVEEPQPKRPTGSRRAKVEKGGAK